MSINENEFRAGQPEEPLATSSTSIPWEEINRFEQAIQADSAWKRETVIEDEVERERYTRFIVRGEGQGRIAHQITFTTRGEADKRQILFKHLFSKPNEKTAHMLEIRNYGTPEQTFPLLIAHLSLHDYRASAQVVANRHLMFDSQGEYDRYYQDRSSADSLQHALALIFSRRARTEYGVREAIQMSQELGMKNIWQRMDITATMKTVLLNSHQAKPDAPIPAKLQFLSMPTQKT